MPVISTNTAANTAVRYLNINSMQQSDALAKLSSGSRITKASDDAAGLAIATRIGTDGATLQQAATNASNAISILQVADGGASNISDILQRMKVLSATSASGTVTDDERVYINAEFQQLTKEVNTISTSTRYNGSSLLAAAADATNAAMSAEAAFSNTKLATETSATLSINGTSITVTGSGTGSVITSSDLLTAINGQTATTKVAASTDTDGRLLLTSTGTAGTTDTITLTSATATALNMSATSSSGAAAVTNTVDWNSGINVMVGASSTDMISLQISNMTAHSLNVNGLGVSTQAGANYALTALDTAISTVSGERASLGAMMSRFQFQQQSIATTHENLAAAKSSISDVDIAAEEGLAAAAAVKVSAAVAASAQANQMPQALMKLLG